MIKAEIRYGEGHYKAIARNARKPMTLIVIYCVLFAAGLTWMLTTLIPMFDTGLWLLTAYFTVFFIAAGYKLVRIVMAMSAMRTDFMKDNAGRAEYLTFDGDEVVLRFDRGFEESEKHLKYPAVRSAEKRGQWYTVMLKDDRAVFCADELTQGTPEALDALLAEKLGDRFKLIQEGGK